MAMTTMFQVEVWGWRGRERAWNSCGPEFRYESREAAERSVAVSRINDRDNGYQASYRVTEVAQ